MKRYEICFLSIAATLFLATGCNESVHTEEAPPDPEEPTLECPADGGTIIGSWKCAENTLSQCVAGKWVVNQTCPENTTCNAVKGSCDTNVAPECADGTWKCEGNTLSRCIAGKWEIRQACPENALCNSDTGTCDIDEPECTNNTWSCDGNTLSKCVAETWKTIQTCEAPAQCNEETGACEIECKDTEHLFAERCEADDITHCGTHTNDCTKMSGWKTGNCIGKKCFAEECETGYHLASIFDSDNKERTICQEDTHDACGSINTRCGAEEICTLGECKDTCRRGARRAAVNVRGEWRVPVTAFGARRNHDFCGSIVLCLHGLVKKLEHCRRRRDTADFHAQPVRAFHAKRFPQIRRCHRKRLSAAFDVAPFKLLASDAVPFTHQDGNPFARHGVHKHREVRMILPLALFPYVVSVFGIGREFRKLQPFHLFVCNFRCILCTAALRQSCRAIG